MMSTRRQAHSEAARPYWSNYYRATAVARMPGIADSVRARSLYLHDILMLCLRGAWELELRQFMPPASLNDTVTSLLDLGLIECMDGPVSRSRDAEGLRASVE